MLDYIIIALPRSGTAWVANLLSSEDRVCRHDPLGTLIDPVKVIELEGGCADTGMGYFPELVNKVRAKVVIQRPRVDCMRGLKAIWVNLPGVAMETLEARISQVDADLIVKFDDLFSFDSSNAIHKLCLGRELSHERHAFLQEMNVQTRARP